MDSFIQDRRLQEILILAILLILVLPVVIFILYGNDAVEVFSVITSSILSLGLVILYFRQQSTMEKQTRLMDREYASSLNFGPDAFADGNEIIFKLKNTGRGRVRHIKMRCDIVSDTSGVDVQSGETTLTHYENDNFDLEPDSEYERYSGRAMLTLPAEYEGRDLPYTIISNMLSNEGIDRCQVRLSLEVVDESLQSPHLFEIANQEIATGGSIEDGIEVGYSSNQDINKKSFEDRYQ